MQLFIIGLIRSANHALRRLAARTQQLHGEQDPPPNVVPYLGARSRPSQVLDVRISHARQIWHLLSVATQIPFGVPYLLPFWMSNLHKFWGQIWGHVWLGLETRFGACLGRAGFVSCARSEHFWSILVAKPGAPSGYPIWDFVHSFWQFLGPDLGPFLDPKNGPPKWSPINKIRESEFWTPKMDPNLDPKTGPQNLEFGPKNRTQKLTPKNGLQKRTQKWTPKMNPKNGPQ